VRYLANENMPNTVVEQLRLRGHDVLAAKESMRGSQDVDVLNRAQVESRILISQDKDFWELAFRTRLPAECGVILFRLPGQDPDADIRRMNEVTDSSNDWAGCFVVVDEARVRIRKLPLPRKI